MDPYTTFVYGIRSPYTEESYCRRLRGFFDAINLGKDKTLNARCNSFVHKGRADPNFYHTYCLKIIAAEHLPRESRAEAFLTRCLIIFTSPGVPRYKIDKVVDPAGDKEYEKIKAQLLYLRKVLFAYRLIHFSEPIPDVELNITGRDEELCSPLIRLFKNNAKVLKTVRETLYRFIIEKKTKHNKIG